MEHINQTLLRLSIEVTACVKANAATEYANKRMIANERRRYLSPLQECIAGSKRGRELLSTDG